MIARSQICLLNNPERVVARLITSIFKRDVPKDLAYVFGGITCVVPRNNKLEHARGYPLGAALDDIDIIPKVGNGI